MEIEQKRGPGRPRKEPVDQNDPIPADVRKRRAELLERRRGGNGAQMARLFANMDRLDTANFAYRWIGGDAMRMFNLTKNDVWETINQDGVRPDVTGTVSVVTGTNENGAPVPGYLVRKPKVYFDEDKKLRSERIEMKMSRIQRAEDDAAVDNSYTPNGGGIKISRG